MSEDDNPDYKTDLKRVDVSQFETGSRTVTRNTPAPEHPGYIYDPNSGRYVLFGSPNVKIKPERHQDALAIFDSQVLIVISTIILALAILALFRADEKYQEVAMVVIVISSVSLFLSFVRFTRRSVAWFYKTVKTRHVTWAKQKEDDRKAALWARYIRATKGSEMALTKNEFMYRDAAVHEQIVQEAEAQAALDSEEERTGGQSVWSALGLNAAPIFKTQTAMETNWLAKALATTWSINKGVFWFFGSAFWMILGPLVSLLSKVLVYVAVVTLVVSFFLYIVSEKLRQFILTFTWGRVDIGDWSMVAVNAIKSIGIAFLEFLGKIVQSFGGPDVATEWRKAREEEIRKSQEEMKRKEEERIRMIEEEERKKKEEKIRQEREEYFSETRLCRYLIGFLIAISFIYGITGSKATALLFKMNLYLVMIVAAFLMMGTFYCYESYDNMSMCWILGFMSLACVFFFKFGLYSFDYPTQIAIFVIQMALLGFLYYTSCIEEPLFEDTPFKTKFGRMPFTTQIMVGVPLVLLFLGPVSWFTSLVITYAPLVFVALSFFVLSFSSVATQPFQVLIAFLSIVFIFMARMSSEQSDESRTELLGKIGLQEAESTPPYMQMLFVVVMAIVAYMASFMIQYAKESREYWEAEERYIEENREKWEQEEEELRRKKEEEAKWFWTRIWEGMTNAQQY